MLADVPPGADADDEPAAGDVIEERRLLGEDAGMAERIGEHAMTQPAARDAVRERGGDCQRFPARAAALPVRVGQVVVHPDRLEYVVLADPRPGGVDGWPVDRLR